MKIKKVSFFFALLCWLYSSAYGQSITGEVIDKVTNAPVIGANISVPGTSTGVITDMAGKFSLNLPGGAKQLQVTFIGYQKQLIDVQAGGYYKILLEPDVTVIDEVVVVGYGTQKKANLTGSVSTVDTKILEARPIADVGRGLQGTMPGLSVVVPSGEIGSDPLMKIRGQIGSLQGGSSPLILVDNVEIPSLQILNPDDVESVSILKDAASSSIYGAKAAFGVILITTKKGAKTESVNVSYSGNTSFQNISKKMEMAGIDGMEYTLNAFERVGGTVAGAFWMVTREGYDKAKIWQEKYAGTVKPNDPMLYGRDWYVDANARKIGLRMYDPYDYMIREWAPTQTHNLSVNGKSGKTDYNIGFGYLDQSGIIKPSKHDDFKRYNGSIRLSTEINKYLKVYTGAMYSKRVKRYAYATNSTTADPWLYLYRWASTYPMTTEDGDPIRSPQSEMANANTAFQETNYISLNGGIEITPIKNWKINLDYTHANQEYITERPGTRFTARDSWSAPVVKNDADGNRIYMNDAGAVVSSTDPGAMPAYMLNMWTYTAVGANPDHIYRYSKNDKWNTINLKTTYEMNINDVHKLNYMLGMNRVGWDNAYNWSQTTQLIDYTNPEFDLAYGTQTTSGGKYWESQLGFFGRLNYNFKERYLLEANLRYDGTSKFPTNLQWRWFPSFSAGWRVNEESWMDWSKSVLSALKLRGSWGTIGDQTVPNSLYIPTMTGSQSSWIISGARLYQFGTPAAVSATVTWQDITTLDYGFDARFLNSSLGFSLDWYRRDTKNMIVPQEGLPTTFGTGAPQSNFGSLQTDGIELQLDYNHQFKNGFGFNFVATFSNSTTKITKYGSTNSIDSWYVGKTYGEIWGYETDRLYQKDDFAYDVNNNLIKVQVTDPHGVIYTVYQLSDANAPTQGKLQAGNFYFGPGDVKFKDLNGDGVIDAGSRLIKDADGNPDYGDLKKIGNSTPRFLYSFRTDLNYKGFDLSVFIQGVGKREIWGNGFLAIPGYNSADGAMPQAIAGNFWREDRPNAFYPAPYNLAGSNNTLNMVPQSRYLLNMAYLRMKNITVGYTLPESLFKKVHISKLRVYAALENFFTFDHLGTLPIDPEEIDGYSMWNDTNYNSSRSGVGVPTFKSASVGVQLNF
jgi:TonB-linked outer membrane protein, SusC/RagA family/TonB-dependent outer membrane receptor, SusC/RagA subfamily, signature region